MKNTIIILGDSPFLKEVETYIRPLLKKYYSIGINNVITKYYTNEHAFLDMPFTYLTNKFVGKTVTTRAYEDLLKKDNKCLLGTYPFDFNKNTEKDIYTFNHVAWCGFTHDFAISYCVKEGYKRIILLGAGDFSQGSHFSNPHAFQFAYACREKSKKFIEEYVSKVVRIETCNPNSYLNIPRVTIQELLK